MIWEPFVLALVLGLIVSGGLYYAYLWPSVEPLDPGDPGEAPEPPEPPKPVEVIAAIEPVEPIAPIDEPAAS